MRVEEGTVDFDGHRTWYRITTDGPRAGRPLVALHGGPGATHDYLLSLTDLVRPDRPVSPTSVIEFLPGVTDRCAGTARRGRSWPTRFR